MSTLVKRGQIYAKHHVQYFIIFCFRTQQIRVIPVVNMSDRVMRALTQPGFAGSIPRFYGSEAG
ncbi:MAG: hypothetical protein DYH16_01320 [Nitrosomonas sp. PRO5]|nr:hypothetical protein [Nitrosomonas sp. PRO5]